MNHEPELLLPPDQPPDKQPSFCPFAPIVIPGPLGKLTITHAPCDPNHCAVGHPGTDLCSFLHIVNMIELNQACVLQLRPSLENIASTLKTISNHINAINRSLPQAKTK